MTAYAVTAAGSRAAGIDISAAPPNSALATGDTFPPGNDVYLRLKTTGTANTVTITNSGLDPYGRGVQPYTIGGGALPATSDKVYGPFPAAAFADPSDGQVHLSFSGATTGMSLAVYRLAQN